MRKRRHKFTERPGSLHERPVTLVAAPRKRSLQRRETRNYPEFLCLFILMDHISNHMQNQYAKEAFDSPGSGTWLWKRICDKNEVALGD